MKSFLSSLSSLCAIMRMIAKAPLPGNDFKGIIWKSLLRFAKFAVPTGSMESNEDANHWHNYTISTAII